MNPAATDLPQQPGTVAATLFRYNGSGQVVLVGPAGWLTNACIEVSPISQGLRPFETAYYESTQGTCPDAQMRATTVGCVSDTTIMLDLRLPEGEVGLEEGGTAAVSTVRVKLMSRVARLRDHQPQRPDQRARGERRHRAHVRGAVGEPVNFDVGAATGAPVVGSCVLS